MHQRERSLGASFLPYGPTSQGASGEGVTLIAERYGPYEAEYAAIRQRVGIMHLPQRGLLRLTGMDRRDFLHRMMTQDISAMLGGSTKRSLQLNQKGRIVADVVVHHGDENTWLDTDAVDIAPLRELLEARLFSDDVQIEEVSDERTLLALQGPAAVALLHAVTHHDAKVKARGTAAGDGQGDPTGGDEPAISEAGTHHVVTLNIEGGPTKVTAYRWDDCGVLGLRLWVQRDHAAQVWDALLDQAGYDAAGEASPDADYAQRRRGSLRGRPVGWLAYNTARIEAGTVLFHIDLGPDSLPGETPLLDIAVSFTGGCYLGQEIVARMKNLGHPKRVLVGLRIEAREQPADVDGEGVPEPSTGERLPVAGSQVLSPGATPTRAGDVVGAVTSSTLSPLLGHEPIAFAVVKWGQHELNTRLRVVVEGELVDARVVGMDFLHGE